MYIYLKIKFNVAHISREHGFYGLGTAVKQLEQLVRSESNPAALLNLTMALKSYTRLPLDAILHSIC